MYNKIYITHLDIYLIYRWGFLLYYLLLKKEKKKHDFESLKNPIDMCVCVFL